MFSILSIMFYLLLSYTCQHGQGRNSFQEHLVNDNNFQFRNQTQTFYYM